MCSSQLSLSLSLSLSLPLDLCHMLVFDLWLIVPWLQVSIPGNSMLNIVTVRCGHCTNLLSVNLRALMHSLPEQDQLQVTIGYPHKKKNIHILKTSLLHWAWFLLFCFCCFRAVVVFLLFPLCRCTGWADESPPDILTTEPARKLERWRAVVLAALLLRSIKKNYF